MSTSTELWKKRESKIVDERFPLRQWLGSSDHSAVFLTERPGAKSQKFAIKLIPAPKLGEEAQLSRWTDAGKLSHPHLLKLFECGRCQIDGSRFLYVVMEYAEENLAEILPLRPLSSAEASEMLRPAAEGLGFLHRAGFVHGSLKPSNIMAAGNQLKLSADGLRKIWEPAGARTPSAYDAPEVATGGLSTAADIWSLGRTLVAVATQNEPKPATGEAKPVAVPDTIPQPLRGIASQCLQFDPKLRCTVGEILSQLEPPGPTSHAKPVHAQMPHERPKRWLVVTIVALALLVGVWLGLKLLFRQSPGPAADNRAVTQAPSAEGPSPQPRTAPPEQHSSAQTSAKERGAHGSVLQQVMPDISRGAQNTITGKVKVSVQVTVDASGNVSEARFVSPGPSKYFAARSEAAARRWTFTPPRVDGQATSSEWLLRFQIGRASVQAFPTQTKP